MAANSFDGETRTEKLLLPRPADYYLDKVRVLHVTLRDLLLRHLHDQETGASSGEPLAGVADVRGGDTIYTIDAHICLLYTSPSPRDS